MNGMTKIVLCTTGLIALALGGANALAQPAVPDPSCAYCGTSLPNGVHSSSCPYYRSSAKPGGPRSSNLSSRDINTMVAGALFESLLKSMFAGPAATEQEARAAREEAIALARQQATQRAQQAAAQAKYEKMMQSYKPLDGAQGTAFKTLSDSSLALKTLDGDAETLAAGAGKPFDTPSDSLKPSLETTGRPTPFFGDTMPSADLQLLVHPENDPRVVDLRNAVSFVVESIKMDGERLAARTRPYTGDENSDPRTQPQYCKDLATKLDPELQANCRGQQGQRACPGGGQAASARNR